MCANNPYKKHSSVISQLMDLGNKNQSYALKRFAILHQEDQDILFDIALNENNQELKTIAVQKIKEEDKLMIIAQSRTSHEIKAIAISRIYDKKKLMHLRLSEESSLQPLIYNQFQNNNDEIQFSRS